MVWFASTTHTTPHTPAFSRSGAGGGANLNSDARQYLHAWIFVNKYVYMYMHVDMIRMRAYVHPCAYCHFSKLGWQTDPVAGVTPVLIPQ